MTNWLKPRWLIPNFWLRTSIFRISFLASPHCRNAWAHSAALQCRGGKRCGGARCRYRPHRVMKSPGHRANILHQDYNAIGISIVERDHTLFITQDFAHTLASYTEKQFRES